MNTDFDEENNIEDWMDGGPVDDDPAPDVLAPKHGWDNPCDVREAKNYLRDMSGLCRRSTKDLPKVTEMARRLRSFGISQRLAADLIRTVNEAPFPRREIENFTADAYRIFANVPGLLSQAGRPENEWTPAQADDPDDDSWMDGGLAVWPRALFFDKNEKNNSRLAEFFLSERPAKLIFSDNVLYSLHDNRVWRELSDVELAAEIRQTDPALVIDAQRIFGIVTAIKLAVFTKARPFEWIEEPYDAPAPNNLILFRNGILDFETGELRPHDGSYFATGLPNLDYDPAATCPLWIEKLSEWLPESYHLTLQEFTGYLLTPDTSIHAMLAMIGVTRGGKGTITTVQQDLVGPAHACSRTLNDIANDFGLEGTTDKRALFIPDAHSAATRNRAQALERLKSISGGDALSINRKNKGMVTARVPAKIIIVANQPPKFLDESGALAARQVVLEFANSFRGREDTELGTKLRAELPGIANWALEGLRRLRDNGGKFTIGREGKSASRELALAQSPALRFASEHLIVTNNAEDFVPLDLVHESYSHWATYEEELGSREKRNRADFKADLMAALAALGVRYGRRRWRDPAKHKSKYGIALRTWGFIGLRLKARTLGDE